MLLQYHTIKTICTAVTCELRLVCGHHLVVVTLLLLGLFQSLRGTELLVGSLLVGLGWMEEGGDCVEGLMGAPLAC